MFVHASCKKLFTNLADTQAWPSWYPNSHDVKLLNSLDGKLHPGTRFSWDTHIRVTYRCTDEGDGQIYQGLQQQASILSYIDVLQTLAIFCACMVPLVLLMKRPPKTPRWPSTNHAHFTSGAKQMRILSNSSVALAGVLAIALCIPAANGQTFPAGVTPVCGAVTAVTANSVTVQTPQLEVV